MFLPISEFTPDALRSVVEHVFMPPKLPQQAPNETTEQETSVALCRLLLEAARDFHQCLSQSQRLTWTHIIKMMELVWRNVRAPSDEGDLQSTLSSLIVGDVFVKHIRAQNAAVVVRKLIDDVRFEVFEVLPLASAVMSTNGKLLCSYPGPAIKVSTELFANKSFLKELSSFLTQMDADILDSTATTVKAGSTVREVRESADPKYISGLLVGILRGFGQAAAVDRITKRIGDEVLWKEAYKPWRRSGLWLVIRVALQTSHNPDNLYKLFILFFHAHLLRLCSRRDFPSELLFGMRVKMARRLAKLGSAVPGEIYQAVYDAATETEKLLQSRWSDFQRSKSMSPPWLPERLDFVTDTTISLDNSQKYLTKILLSMSQSSPLYRFTPSHRPRLHDIVDFSQFSGQRLIQAVSEDKRTALADFELSVERHLDAWVVKSQSDDDAPDVIASCIEQYFTSAQEVYQTDPEDNSVMILTVMNLWKALDTLLIRQCPLLASYSPEIPRKFLHQLLLHRTSSLRCALHIEEYLSRRHEEASCSTSIFLGKAVESSFAVQYFRNSQRLQQLYATIDQHAQQERENKRAELDTLNQKCQSLTEAASSMSHTYSEDDEGNLVIHQHCEKCLTEKQAQNLRIGIHEWPLPEATVEAQWVVFELSPPRGFSTWREITYKILRDIGMPNVEDDEWLMGEPKVLLDAFSGLQSWSKRHAYHRITIGSTTKSFKDQTHYRTAQIPATESSVLLNNGLSFKLFDRTNRSWVSGTFLGSSVTKFCQPPTPPSGPYRHLHRTVLGTRHTSNEMIASQAECPKELSLHEYLAFSTLRSGPRLQWLNIARELASPSLSFRQEEVHSLITQAAWQLGPLTDGVREWHIDLGIPEFGRILLHELDGLLERVQTNWLEEVTVRTVALVTTRLLSSTKCPDICARAYVLLRNVRMVTHRWVGQLCSKLDMTQDETSRENLRHQLCSLAATCVSTVDVCVEHLPNVFSTDDDLAIVMQCAVIVHDNIPLIRDDVSHFLNRTLNRHHRLLHFLEKVFLEGLRSNSSGFDIALARLWSGYRRQSSSTWRVLTAPNSRWFSCNTEGGQEVLYNVITGELLVGGKPLGRLPKEIIEHSTYATILGKRILDVVPADVPGMEFMTRSTVSGYQILLSRRDVDVILQARRPRDSQLLQFVPRAVLDGDFPKSFINDYVHWLDLATGELEFRPAESPWIPEPSNWRLHISMDRNKSHAMIRKISGDNCAFISLVDIRSPTFQMISRPLSALESPEHITIVRTPQTVEASLPRLRLSFFINDKSEIECQSIPGYVIDKHQSSGTMFGLTNQLVLCPTSDSFELPRRVIIPQGDVSFTLDGDFAKVSISAGTEQLVHWYEYTIDTDLGRLSGNVSLGSKLYQCYLHAITSHCLPDPLLGQTGTEEAVHMLRSAAFRSFQGLGNYEAKLLTLISKLTPRRCYYPPHLESMATVEWHQLPTLSQHHDFHPDVCSVFNHAQALEALYDSPITFDIPERTKPLLNRAAIRNRVYYPHDMQSSAHSPSSSLGDVVYRSRDVDNGGNDGHAAYQISRAAWNGQPSLSRKGVKLWDAMKSWKSIGPPTWAISLRYCRYWLYFNIAQDWIEIYRLCLEMTSHNRQDVKITLAFSLAAASFNQPEYRKILPLILIFATDDRFQHLRLPDESQYTLSDGICPDYDRLVTLISESANPINRTPASTMAMQSFSKKKAKKQRRGEYCRVVNEKASAAARTMVDQWPEKQIPSLPRDWFDSSTCEAHVEPYFQSIVRNSRLKDHIEGLQTVLNHYNTACVTDPLYKFFPLFNVKPSEEVFRSVRHLLRLVFLRDITPQPPFDPSHALSEPSSMTTVTRSIPRITKEDGLGDLIQEFRSSQKRLLRLYGDDLSKSHSELLQKEDLSATERVRVIPSYKVLRDYRDACRKRKDAMFSKLSMALKPNQRVDEVLSTAGLWPRITPRLVLRQLSRDHATTLTEQCKDVIIRYAAAFLKYQQSQRLLELALRHQDDAFFGEAETICEEVVEECSCEWLLIQIDANILARPLQLAIAREMISPTSKRSTSLQLNMGEGKSSVIVPLVSSALANGSCLVRVVTLKPLSNQMLELLIGRLSGLASRPIFYMPFSRNLKISTSVVQKIGTLYKQCVADGGVLVTQPEHILSQKLMCIDTLLESHSEVEKLSISHELKALQDWLAKGSRDILDESDEILHVRYQLVYTAGEQMPVEDHPNRWSTTQQVFSRLQGHARQIHVCFPKLFELDENQRGFPLTRILNHEVSRNISSLIVDDALKGALSSLPLAVLSPQIREATRSFILQRDVPKEIHDAVRSHCAGTTLWNGILLLRGLLVDGEGILGYVLKERRWRVDYGLDPSRTLLAVPYRAKDVPSLRAEFGHPDVAIALTCLSYYYGGLNKNQILLCFDLLTKLDNPEVEYDHWVESGTDIPKPLCQLNGVNTKDDTQVDDHLVPLFSRSKTVIDFYLSQVVFPRAAKESQFKLSSSAWDLVEDKKNVTTGFSGTNDNRYLLPTSITQEDPVSQLSTNALVLEYLLRAENNHYECTEGHNGERESAEGFLKRLIEQTPEIRVLLDVGAQMLELQNEDLARYWLSLRPDISAAVFFNDSDHLTVLTRDGSIESFISSPFSRQLDRCIVYLDDAHTRGTDLKLPRECRAAVTLGPKVTKDRLLQGCMRMRQLGKGQSVMFFAPGEVDRHIRSLIPSDRGICRRIEALDIIRWAMHETCEDIRHHLPHWAQQGVDHHHRFSAYKLHGSTGDLDSLRSNWLQPECKTLEQMYDPISDVQSTGASSEISCIPALHDRMELLGVVDLFDVRMAEEQEREVNHEMERERHVQRPPTVYPAQHIIHDDIRTFVMTGQLPETPSHILPLFSPIGIDGALNSTTEWSPSPLATKDFAVTTAMSSLMRLTDYLRPVNWILSSGTGRNSVIIVISPYEANELLPIVRKSNQVRLHIYAPRVCASMRPFSNLAFYPIPGSLRKEWSAPAHIRTELNLFAGQLYFDNREEYEKVCVLLALHMAHPGAERIEVDGFVLPAYRTGEPSPFDESKIGLFKELIGLRRKGTAYGGTDLGHVLDARPLSSEFEQGKTK